MRSWIRPLTLFLAFAGTRAGAQTPAPTFDLVVYGGTSAGVVAAVQGRRAGLEVLLIEPTRHVGGLSAAGLGATDTGNKAAIGGLSREFYRRVRDWYADPLRWTRERREDFRGWREGEDALWFFEPRVAERIFEDLLAEAGVLVVRNERLDRTAPPVMAGRRLSEIATVSGRRFRGRMFVDATYEGDLMALAGVPYTVGREANATYGETLNGVQTANAVHHQFVQPVDPYVVPGDPSSGLLPGIHDRGPGEEGAADAGVQAYCFRLCLTDDPANRIPFAKPNDYDEARYELLLRHFEAGAERLPWHSIGMPNRKTDTNNNRAFSTDHIGANHAYPEADDATRAAIVADHESYQRGLVWTLANHPRVPDTVRAEASRWGLAADEFVDNGGWPHALYVREARRMVSDYVVTEHDCRGTRRPSDSVGLGAYNMDSHNVQRYVDADGHARNEGDVQVPPEAPYPIPYRSIVPPEGSVENLFVPVCLSASHIAYGSIRMEPVFMILGHSSATAAAIALERGLAVQDVPYKLLRKRLLQEGQILTFMEEEEFWSLIEKAKELAPMTEQRPASLAKLLRELPSPKIIAFNRRYGDLKDLSHRWDLWGAAYVMNGGCGDDSFNDFRAWLISEGKRTFHRALADPGTLVELGRVDLLFLEELDYVAERVYRSAEKKNLPTTGRGRQRPAGTPWEEGTVEELFPELHRLYWPPR